VLFRSHKDILQNWVTAINTGSKLLAPGIEGLNSLTLSNAILQEKIANSTVTKDLNENKTLDTKDTY